MKIMEISKEFPLKVNFHKNGNVRVSVDSAFDKGQFGPGIYVAVMYVD